MKTSHWIALGVLAALFFKAQNSSAKQSANTSNAGAGGPPNWASTSGPMGPQINPVTGTLEMMPLKAG